MREPSADPRVPLASLARGESARITDMPFGDTPNRWVRLSALGLVPGAVVVLRQRKPAAIVAIGATRIALDPEIAERILVERVSGS